MIPDPVRNIFLPMSMNTYPFTFGLAALLLLPGLAQAQIKTQPDGH